MEALAQPTTPGSEAEIIQAALAGNPKAFDQLLGLYERKIFGYLYRLTNHPQDAEDLTQETFLKVYRALKTFDTKRKFSTWLYTVATNTAYDWLRKKQRRPELFIIDDEESSFETIDPDSPYTTLAPKIDLGKALATIDKPIYRTVLLLFYRDGLSYQEIAEVLNCPLNTVKTYLRRAKQALRQALESPIN